MEARGLDSTRSASCQSTVDRTDPVATFEEFYRNEYGALLGLALVLTGSRPVAEDLTQDALLEAHRRWDQIAGYDKPGAWLRRVMVNKNTSRYRRVLSESRGLTLLEAMAVVAIAPLEPPAEVWTAVRSLPRRQAEVVALHHLHDLPILDVANILGLSPETVKTHLKRGRAALAVSLASFDQGRSASGM